MFMALGEESNKKTKIYDLATNYLYNPLGIDCENIRFSWKMASNVIGERQRAYELKVFKVDEVNNREILIWEKKAQSEKSVGILYEGEKLEEGTKYSWQVKVFNERGESFAPDKAYFETGVINSKYWTGADFISLSQKSYACPIFRMEKGLKNKKILKARLYITAMGVYLAYVNSNRVGVYEKDGFYYTHLGPGYSNGNVSLTYQTYDITDFLKGDKIAVSVMLGAGWYNGMGETFSKPAFKALIFILYEDGGADYFTTNTSDWKASLDGPVTKSGIYYGEDYDARKEKNLGDYKKAGYDDSGWIGGETLEGCAIEETDKKDALLITRAEYPGKIRAQNGLWGKLIGKYEKQAKSVTIYKGALRNKEYPNGVINVKKHFAANAPKEGIYLDNFIKKDNGIFEGGITLKKGEKMVVDMGQNMAGIPYIKFSANTGTTLTMSFGEMLNDKSKTGDGANDADGPFGSVYQKSLRGARSKATYTFSGEGIEEYAPLLTFFGYQYIGIEATDDVTIYDLRSLALSSVSKRAGYLKTNNESVNKLIENIIYSNLSNYFTTATDCPQRDERLFWTGDTQIFAQSALYNFDCAAFLCNLADILAENARILGYAPSVGDQIDGFFSNFAAGWSDCLIILPYAIYLQTGDVSALSKNYDAFVRYMEFLKENERQKNQAPLFGGMNFGDWLAFQGTAVEVVADLYYAYVTKLMARISDILGDKARKKEYGQKFEDIKAKFLDTYVDFSDNNLTVKSGEGNKGYQFQWELKGGVWEDNSQTALLWMLKLGFYKDEEMKKALVDLLVKNIKNENPKARSIRAKFGKNTLSTGFLGTNIIAPVLSDVGFSDVSYDLLLQDEIPSWLYEVKMGATTVWERWDSYSQAGFGDCEMNSFNHYAYGAVIEWMYRYMAGISYDEKNPGFCHIKLMPQFDTSDKYNSEERINYVNCTYQSYYGDISVEWKTRDKKLKYLSVEIPANTYAALYLPKDLVPAQSIYGVSFIGLTKHNDTEVLEFSLKSGGYVFYEEGGKLHISYKEGYLAI